MADSDDDFNDSKFRDKFKRQKTDFESHVKKSKSLGEKDNEAERSRDVGHTSYRKRHYDSRNFDRSDSPYQKRFRRYPSDVGGRRNRNDRVDDMPLDSPKRNFNTVVGTTDPNRSSFTETFGKIQSFKSFVMTLDDNVFPDQAVENYMEYVKTFSDKHVHPFFNFYSKCDWMILKYHPIWKVREDIFDRKCRKIRCLAFLKLGNIFNVESIRLEDDKCLKIHFKFLLLINALLEGGSEIALADLISAIDTYNNKAEIDNDIEDDDDLESKIFSKSTANTYCEPKVDGPHITVSFFVRSIPIRISRSELIDAYEKIPGYLRIYLTEPLLGRRDHRCAIVTFRSDVDSKATLLDINNIVVQESVRLPVRIKFDLSRKVKVQILKDGFYMTKEHIIFDVGMVGKLIRMLDELYGVFETLPPLPKLPEELNTENSVPDESTEAEFIWKSSIIDIEDEYKMVNPQDSNEFLLKLEELQKNQDLANLSIDEITKILDPAVLYLRVVHGIDYYSGQEFLSEHCKDTRCSLLTVRQKIYGDDETLPFNFQTRGENYSLYVDLMEAKFAYLLTSNELSDEDARVIGLKDPDQEIEAFIELNTVKKDENRYLCPLSNKKFKTTDFVKKHILTKHTAKIDNVRMAAVFFNNFLKDKYKNLPFNPELMKRGIWSSTGSSHIRQTETHQDGVHRPFFNRSFKKYAYRDLDAPGGGLFGI